MRINQNAYRFLKGTELVHHYLSCTQATSREEYGIPEIPVQNSSVREGGSQYLFIPSWVQLLTHVPPVKQA